LICHGEVGDWAKSRQACKRAEADAQNCRMSISEKCRVRQGTWRSQPYLVEGARRCGERSTLLVASTRQVQTNKCPAAPFWRANSTANPRRGLRTRLLGKRALSKRLRRNYDKHSLKRGARPSVAEAGPHQWYVVCSNGVPQYSALCSFGRVRFGSLIVPSGSRGTVGGDDAAGVCG
jgi:hypothetical protein